MRKYYDCIRKDGNCYICSRASHGFDCHGVSEYLPRKLEEKINEYVDTFGEGVPVFCMPPMTDEELISLIDQCIETGTPIEPDLPDDPSIIF